MRRWDIYWADYPHEEDPSVMKRRPAIIANDKQIYVLVLKVTTHDVRDNDPNDYKLQYWKEAGLSRESVVRIRKIAQLLPEQIHEYIGRVHSADAYAIQLKMNDIRNSRDD